MINRVLLCILSVIALSSLTAGCGDRSEGSQRNKPLVVATTTIIADITQQIAGDRVEIFCIMPVGGDPHIYQPVPGDARQIARSDLVLLNGLQLEGWLTELARHAGGSRPMIAVTEGIVPLQDEARHGEPDPHAWFDVRNMHYYVDNIVRGLSMIDSDGEAEYRERADEYKRKLDELDAWVRERIESLPDNRRILITSHDAFRYFGEAYGIRVMALQGISTEAQPQTRDVVELVRAIREYSIPAVFIETSVNPKMLEQIARDAGARIGGELFSDSLGHPDHEGGTYLGMVMYNVSTFVEAMKQEPLTLQ
jgi:ABC-type Zn uptake system ZnuABC Zn-binding protein ZnuA